MNSDLDNQVNGPLTLGALPTMAGDSNLVSGKVDHFVLKSALGVGGFGAVFLAEDSVAGIEVALKVLPPLVSTIPDEMERVRENFALVSRLHHPNIASLLQLHRITTLDQAASQTLKAAEGGYLVVMEYAQGSVLSNWCKRYSDRKVPVDMAINIARGVASALDFAHSQKIVHRDIKPSNIIVNMDGANVKVLDFGLAAEIRSSMARVSQEKWDSSGTRPYMAPEQWCGRRQGPYTDLYALAVLFYELVGGIVPFSSVFETNDMILMKDVVKTEAPERLVELSKKQNIALAKALGKDPEQRFSSCVEFVDALLGSVKVKPVKPAKVAKVKPPKAPREPSKPGRGLKFLAALGAFSLILAGGGWGIMQLVDWLESKSEPRIEEVLSPDLGTSSGLGRRITECFQANDEEAFLETIFPDKEFLREFFKKSINDDQARNRFFKDFDRQYEAGRVELSDYFRDARTDLVQYGLNVDELQYSYSRDTMTMSSEFPFGEVLSGNITIEVTDGVRSAEIVAIDCKKIDDRIYLFKRLRVDGEDRPYDRDNDPFPQPTYKKFPGKSKSYQPSGKGGKGGR